MLSISLIAAFPELAEHALGFGVTGRALKLGLWRYQGFGLHDFATDARKSIDARPAAGGPGMVLVAAPLDAALAAARAWHGAPTTVVFLSPDGAPLLQSQVQTLAAAKQLTFVAGRYEGIDQRWIDANVDVIVSIGDYVLSGGELPAAVVIDSCVRLLPGALGDNESAAFESFSAGRRSGHPRGRSAAIGRVHAAAERPARRQCGRRSRGAGRHWPTCGEQQGPRSAMRQS